MWAFRGLIVHDSIGSLVVPAKLFLLEEHMIEDHQRSMWNLAEDAAILRSTQVLTKSGPK